MLRRHVPAPRSLLSRHFERAVVRSSRGLLCGHHQQHQRRSFMFRISQPLLGSAGGGGRDDGSASVKAGAPADGIRASGGGGAAAAAASPAIGAAAVSSPLAASSSATFMPTAQSKKKIVLMPDREYTQTSLQYDLGGHRAPSALCMNYYKLKEYIRDNYGGGDASSGGSSSGSSGGGGGGGLAEHRLLQDVVSAAKERAAKIEALMQQYGVRPLDSVGSVVRPVSRLVESYDYTLRNGGGNRTIYPCDQLPTDKEPMGCFKRWSPNPAFTRAVEALGRHPLLELFGSFVADAPCLPNTRSILGYSVVHVTVVNADEVTGRSMALLPPVKEHTMVGQEKFMTFKGMTKDDWDYRALQEAYNDRGYTSKWWCGVADLGNVWVPKANRVYARGRRRMEYITLNDVPNPSAKFLYPSYSTYRVYPLEAKAFLTGAVHLYEPAKLAEHLGHPLRKEVAEMIKHTKERGLPVPFYLPFRDAEVPRGKLVGDVPIADRSLCFRGKSVPLDAAHRHRHYNIDQLQRPLPPPIVAHLRACYEAEAERLATLRAAKDPTAYWSVADDGVNEGDPMIGMPKEVCISAELGNPIWDISGNIRRSTFPTKIFFTTAYLLKSGIKILPNAVPLMAPEYSTDLSLINVCEFESPLMTIASSAMCLYNEGVAYEDQRPDVIANLVQNYGRSQGEIE